MTTQLNPPMPRIAKTSLLDMPMAITAGVVGAFVGAGVWAALVVFANVEVGYVAMLIGFLAGLGVNLGAGPARGKSLQILAAACAVAGLLVAKYVIFAHFVREGAAAEGAEVAWWDPEIFSYFVEAITEMVSMWDALWLFLAVSTAYRIPGAAADNTAMSPPAEQPPAAA